MQTRIKTSVANCELCHSDGTCVISSFSQEQQSTDQGLLTTSTSTCYQVVEGDSVCVVDTVVVGSDTSQTPTRPTLSVNGAPCNYLNTSGLEIVETVDCSNIGYSNAINIFSPQVDDLNDTPFVVLALFQDSSNDFSLGKCFNTPQTKENSGTGIVFGAPTYIVCAIVMTMLGVDWFW